MLEQVFLMDLDLHGLDASITDRLVGESAISKSKVNGLQSDLDYFDGAINNENDRAQAAEAALAADILAEQNRAEAAEGVLSADLATEIAARIAAVNAVSDELVAVEESLSTAIEAEEARALAAEAAIVASAGADVAAETARALAAEAALSSDIDGVAFDLTTAQAALSASITSEESARIAGDAATLASAESYTDGAIADLVNSAPALLDTLGEIATALEAEQSATASILTSISNEVTRATAAEGLLDGRLDVLEAKAWRQALLTLSSNNVTSLAKPVGAPAIPNVAAEVQVFIDGRKVFFGSQFNVAVGGGSITFPALRANQTVELLYWA